MWIRHPKRNIIITIRKPQGQAWDAREGLKMKKYTVTITDLVCCDNRIEEVDPWEVDLEGILKEWFSDAPEKEEPYISKYINKIVT